MAIWPLDLPQAPERDSQTHEFPNLVLRTSMDAGPPKMRKRFTAGFRPMTVTYVLTKGQLGTFRAFWETTIAGGSLPFDWPDPLTDTTVSARFTKPPAARPIGGRTWRIECQLEVVP